MSLFKKIPYEEEIARDKRAGKITSIGGAALTLVGAFIPDGGATFGTGLVITMLGLAVVNGTCWGSLIPELIFRGR